MGCARTPQRERAIKKIKHIHTDSLIHPLTKLIWHCQRPCTPGWGTLKPRRHWEPSSLGLCCTRRTTQNKTKQNATQRNGTEEYRREQNERTKKLAKIPYVSHPTEREYQEQAQFSAHTQVQWLNIFLGKSKQHGAAGQDEGWGKIRETIVAHLENITTTSDFFFFLFEVTNSKTSFDVTFALFLFLQVLFKTNSVNCVNFIQVSTENEKSSWKQTTPDADNYDIPVSHRLQRRRLAIRRGHCPARTFLKNPTAGINAGGGGYLCFVCRSG